MALAVHCQKLTIAVRGNLGVARFSDKDDVRV